MKNLLCLLPLMLGVGEGLGAPFRNLDFQSPNTQFLNGPLVNTADAIPGWDLWFGDQPAQMMLYNGVCLTCPGAALGGPEKPKPGDKFLFDIYGGAVPIDPNHTLINESISQMGDVPTSAMSLRFTAVGAPSLLLHVFLGSDELQVDQGEQVGVGHQFGADISRWAGKTAELRFTVQPRAFDLIFAVGLADIHFSPEPVVTVPEPGTLALLCIGGAAVAWHARRRRCDVSTLD